MNPKLLFLGLVYLVQGIPHGLQSSLLPVHLRARGLSLSRVGLAKFLYIPWVLKVFWAPLVDGLGSKHIWLLVTTAGLSFTCLAGSALTHETESQLGLIIVLLTMNVLASLQDVAVDGVAVQLLQGQNELGLGNTAQVVGYKLGSVLGGGALLVCVEWLGWGQIFAVLSVVYGAVTLYLLRTSLPATCGQSQSAEKPIILNPCRVWRELLRVPGTRWTVVYVLIYKLGEQGAVTMFPLFLLDHHMSAAEVGLWNGTVAMCFSIGGSSLAAVLLSRRSLGYLMRSLLVLRLFSMAFQTSLLLFLSRSALFTGAAILSLCVQHFLGGLITTLTFTAMMQCTQKAAASIQATHYSFLATLEVLGKLTFSAFAGSLVDLLGFPISFLFFLLLSGISTLHVCQKQELKQKPS